jgi:hypothetical protein
VKSQSLEKTLSHLALPMNTESKKIISACGQLITGNVPLLHDPAKA